LLLLALVGFVCVESATVSSDFDYFDGFTLWEQVGGCSGGGVEDGVLPATQENDALDCGLELSTSFGPVDFSSGTLIGGTYNADPTVLPGSDFTVNQKISMHQGIMARFVSFTLTEGTTLSPLVVNYHTNLGSDSSTVYISSSNGDNVPDLSDTWVLSRDSSFGDPSVQQVITDSTGNAAACQFTSFSSDNVFASCDLGNFVSGQTKSLVFFIQLGSTFNNNDQDNILHAEEFAASALSIARRGGFNFLTGDELRSVQNFNFPDLSCPDPQNFSCSRTRHSLRFLLDRATF